MTDTTSVGLSISPMLLMPTNSYFDCFSIARPRRLHLGGHLTFCKTTLFAFRPREPFTCSNQQLWVTSHKSQGFLRTINRLEEAYGQEELKNHLDQVALEGAVVAGPRPVGAPNEILEAEFIYASAEHIALFPALAIRVQKKLQFECPEEHVQALAKA